MERKEIALLLAIIKNEYPHSFKDMTKRNAHIKVDLWHELFLNDNAELVLSTVKELIAHRTNPFAPTVGEIKRGMYKQDKLDAGEAWQQVMRAVSNYGLRRTKEAIASLDPNVKNIVFRIGFRDICLSQKIGVERGHFFKLYDKQVETSTIAQITANSMKSIEG